MALLLDWLLLYPLKVNTCGFNRSSRGCHSKHNSTLYRQENLYTVAECEAKKWLSIHWKYLLAMIRKSHRQLIHTQVCSTSINHQSIIFISDTETASLACFNNGWMTGEVVTGCCNYDIGPWQRINFTDRGSVGVIHFSDLCHCMCSSVHV